MNVMNFINSIYLGDRGCKKILIDGWGKEVCIEVDVISRIRSPDGNWNYYDDEDIDNGLVVFKNIHSFLLTPQGKIPNDLINLLKWKNNKIIRIDLFCQWILSNKMGQIKKSL
ncbi:MAG: hypothetical protein COB30_000445 [Ectothiorhodospiraceae bacterium]|nr:hypothetical protein [Ectothiorhodospiraceae bacterium]